jgi:hypothetical protein
MNTPPTAAPTLDTLREKMRPTLTRLGWSWSQVRAAGPTQLLAAAHSLLESDRRTVGSDLDAEWDSAMQERHGDRPRTERERRLPTRWGWYYAARELVQGRRVEAGRPGTADHDTGIVHTIVGDTLHVAWDSGVSTTITARDARVI